MEILNITDIQNVYFINLDHRIDRKKNAEFELTITGFPNIKRFNACKNNNGRIGCSFSHLALLEMAKKENMSHICICEDDICFTDPKLFVSQLNSFLEIEKDWDVILFAGNTIFPFIHTNEFSIKVKHCQTTTGYLIKQSYYDTLIQNIKEGLNLLLKFPEQHFKYAIDKYWIQLQQKDNWFLIYPLSVVQKHGYSDIEKRKVNYENLMLNIR